MASARGAQVPGRTRSNHLDASARYPSDTASWFDSSSYQDASSDQESLYRSSTNRSDSESESSGILDRSLDRTSSIIDRFRQCEPSIPRFQQSTASARGRQREKGVEAAGRSESRGPSARQKRGESQEPGVRRGQDRKNGSPDRRGRSTSRGGWAESVRQSTAPQRRSESQEPGVRSQPSWAENLRRSTDTRELNAGRRRSESQEPGLRSRAGKDDTTARGDWAGNLRSSTDAHGRSRRSESQEPGYRSRTGNDRADWAEDFRRSVDSREQSGRRRRSESQEPGYRSQAALDVLDGRGRRQSTDFRDRERYRRSESQEPGLRNQAGQDDAQDRRGRGTSLRQSSEQSSHHRRSESQEPRRRRSESREPVYGRSRRSESQGPTSTRQYFAPSDAYPADAAEEKTIRAVHSELKEPGLPTESHGASLYDAMRSEVRRAVSDLKTEIEWSLEKDLVTLVKTQGNADIEVAHQPCTKPDESENRDPQFLSLADEEEGRRDVTQLVKLVDAAPKTYRTKFARQKREYISKELNEEAQRFLDEFASISTSEPEDLLVESVSPARASAAVRQSVRTSSYLSEERPSETDCSSPPAKVKPVNNPSPTTESSSPLSERKLKEEAIPRWKTGLVPVNTDGVVMPWLDWEPEIASPLLSDAMFSSGISRSYPCSTIGDVNWEYLASIIPKAPDVDSIHSSDELILQRIRFDARIQAGRMHLCKREF